MIGSIRAESSNFTARYDLRVLMGKLPDPAQRGNFPHSAGVQRMAAMSRRNNFHISIQPWAKDYSIPQPREYLSSAQATYLYAPL